MKQTPVLAPDSFLLPPWAPASAQSPSHREDLPKIPVETLHCFSIQSATVVCLFGRVHHTYVEAKRQLVRAGSITWGQEGTQVLRQAPLSAEPSYWSIALGFLFCFHLFACLKNFVGVHLMWKKIYNLMYLGIHAQHETITSFLSW